MFLGDVFVDGVEGEDGFADAGGGVDPLGVEEAFEEVDGDVEVLVGEAEDGGNAFEERAGFVAAAFGVEGVDAGVDAVHAGGHEGVYAAVESFDHLGDGPAAGYVEASSGSFEDLSVFDAGGDHFDFEAAEGVDLFEEPDDEGQGQAIAGGVPVLNHEEAGLQGGQGADVAGVGGFVFAGDADEDALAAEFEVAAGDAEAFVRGGGRSAADDGYASIGGIENSLHHLDAFGFGEFTYLAGHGGDEKPGHVRVDGIGHVLSESGEVQGVFGGEGGVQYGDDAAEVL